MKKRIASILLIALLLLLCSCGGAENTDVEDSKEISEESTVIPEESYSASEPQNKTISQKVKCSMCNGSGHVKYYYGSSSLEAALDGYDDYQVGPCCSCDGKGYIYVDIELNDADSGKEICPSCEKAVSGLITKSDAAGASRTWCADCWKWYDDIMGN